MCRLRQVFHQHRIVLNLSDMAIDVFGDLVWLFRRRGDVGVLAPDLVHRTANLLEALVGQTDA